MFSPNFSESLSRVVNVFLKHRCTLVTFIEAAEPDEEGNIQYDSVTESNVACLLLWKDESSITQGNVAVIKRTPKLYFRSDRDIAEGDQIQDVLNESGDNIILKRAKINTIDPTAEGGNAVLLVCDLEGVVI